MNNPSTERKGMYLSKIATIWSEDFGIEYELVASILYRFARGEYYGDTTDPYLVHLLSDGRIPQPIPPIFKDNPDLPLKDRLEKLCEPGQKSKEEYLIPNIQETLNNHDPLLDFPRIVSFCERNNISYPDWLDTPIEQSTIYLQPTEQPTTKSQPADQSSTNAQPAE